MSQSSISPSGCRWLSALAALSIAGCSTTESYELGQPIEMGPWTFEVDVRDQCGPDLVCTVTRDIRERG